MYMAKNHVKKLKRREIRKINLFLETKSIKKKKAMFKKTCYKYDQYRFYFKTGKVSCSDLAAQSPSGELGQASGGGGGVS